MSKNILLKKLREIGLNELEATIYIWLLENNRNTGYGIATQINKPVANTYKALKSLEKKGAVISDNSSNNTYFTSVPIEEFLNKIEREFIDTRDQIIKESNNLKTQQVTGGIYELQSAELVFEKATTMINTANITLLVDCYPTPLKQLNESIKEKSSDNIPIFLKNYCDTKFENINQIRADNISLPIEDLGGEWLIVLKDTNESLVSLFDEDGLKLKHGIWTKDSLLSFALFNGSIFEFSYTEIFEKIYYDKSIKVDRIKEQISKQQEMFKFLFSKVRDINKT